MKQSEIIYTGELSTSARHLKSGQVIVTDAPTDNKGKGEAFSPTDLTAASLASCMLTTMGIKAEEKQININGSKAEVIKVMENNPRRIAEIHVHLLIHEGTLSDTHKRFLENIALNCPVAKSLHPDIKQVVIFEYQ